MDVSPLTFPPADQKKNDILYPVPGGQTKLLRVVAVYFGSLRCDA